MAIISDERTISEIVWKTGNFIPDTCSSGYDGAVVIRGEIRWELAEIGKNILTNCMNVKPGENVLIVTDDEKYAIGQTLYQAAKLLKAEAMLMTMTAREVSGQAHPL